VPKRDLFRFSAVDQYASQRAPFRECVACATVFVCGYDQQFHAEFAVCGSLVFNMRVAGKPSCLLIAQPMTTVRQRQPESGRCLGSISWGTDIRRLGKPSYESKAECDLFVCSLRVSLLWSVLL
jgi:hypothetical protein